MISPVSENPTETQFVPDGPAAPIVRSGDETQHVPDLPRFGRFRALAELGSGAMGTVYRAFDDVLGRSVAIKALHARDSATRERFLREARAIGAVLHPNILAVYDAGTAEGSPFLVMELAAGGSLRDRIHAGQLPIATVREVGIQIARALSAAHAANILHRDVKPANILYANQTWKLADFGIARLPDSTLTAEGQFLGSPSYAAPESLGAGRFSPASDVYGLGATLYEALAGVPPHGDHDLRALVRKLDQDPPPLRTHRGVSPALERTIMATLARDPAQRPSADELARLLAVSDANESTVRIAVPASAARAPRASSTRTKAIALALAVIAIVLVAVALTRARPSAAGAQPAHDPRPGATKPTEKPRKQKSKATPAPAERTPSVPAQPTAPAEPTAPAAPAELERDPWASTPERKQPTVVDEYGNPVDEETARKILEQMARDAEAEYEDLGRGRRRGRW